MGGTNNHHVLEVALSDLPELSSISIDLAQLFDLNVFNAPRLATITYAEDRGDAGMRFSETIASTPMIRNVHLQNVPLLRELEIDGMHLERIKVEGLIFLHAFPLDERAIDLAKLYERVAVPLQQGFNKLFRMLEVLMARRWLNSYPCL